MSSSLLPRDTWLRQFLPTTNSSNDGSFSPSFWSGSNVWRSKKVVGLLEIAWTAAYWGPLFGESKMQFSKGHNQLSQNTLTSGESHCHFACTLLWRWLLSDSAMCFLYKFVLQMVDCSHFYSVNGPGRKPELYVNVWASKRQKSNNLKGLICHAQSLKKIKSRWGMYQYWICQWLLSMTANKIFVQAWLFDHA